ncbi:cation efflux protein [Aureobasidium pullulans]|uniref:Cation efflux protein n=1 Tax=Aureobasidium pullulans TaxID=5580 RepID=A0A4V4J475_AURPU|nr:cation efflux protein [Aureobasidium pullulans]
MGLSKSTRICILLAIDTVFFLIELITGYAVHSLALVADSFHMLNDVISLLVGLWAVKVANKETTSKMYTYGWQRAETLGALVNGVFLVALCLSIFLEAIQRFVEPQEVSNPKFVLIVGCLGLASNIVGLFLFHDHGHGGHSHGGHSHGHSHSHGTDAINDAEEGRAAQDEDADVADESGNVADVLPQSRVANWPKTNKTAASGSGSNEDVEAPQSGHRRQKSKHSSRSRSRAYSVEDVPVNPSSFRRSIIETSRLQDIESGETTEESAAEDDNADETPQQPLLTKGGANGYGSIQKSKPIDHKQHKHRQPKEPSSGGGGHGHSHDDLNMRGVFLHVMGDALGNIGVIGSALFIWLTDYSWRFYTDPGISLIITCIILASAIPLCLAASRILLQAVPAGLSIDDIKEDIEELPGIVSAHHLHVWQLSDTKLVASLHVQVDFDFKGEGSARYMELARAIRDCLHEYGIHSSTIQPEFCLDPEHDHSAPLTDETHFAGDGASSRKTLDRQASNANSLRAAADACLLDCDDACNGKSCCAPASTEAASEGAHDHDHDHDHDHGHSQ